MKKIKIRKKYAPPTEEVVACAKEATCKTCGSELVVISTESLDTIPAPKDLWSKGALKHLGCPNNCEVVTGMEYVGEILKPTEEIEGVCQTNPTPECGEVL